MGSRGRPALSEAEGMRAIGRFLSVDPLAGKYPRNSGHVFSENRVLDGVELEGLEWQPYDAADMSAQKKMKSKWIKDCFSGNLQQIFLELLKMKIMNNWSLIEKLLRTFSGSLVIGVLFVGFFLYIFSSSSCSRRPAPDQCDMMEDALINEPSVKLWDLGHSIYYQNCISCHNPGSKKSMRFAQKELEFYRVCNFFNSKEGEVSDPKSSAFHNSLIRDQEQLLAVYEYLTKSFIP